MGTGYLIDTNIAIYYLEDYIPLQQIDFIEKIINEQGCVSVVTEIELLSWNPIDKQELVLVNLFVNTLKVMPLDTLTVRATVAIRQQFRLKLPDAIIAASALVNDLTLITRNEKDFSRIKNLKIYNPFFN